jgi:hypothetical protein
MSDANPGNGWRKSSYSLTNGHCLEAASLENRLICVRDSRAPEGTAANTVLRFTPNQWTALLTALRTSRHTAN